MTHEILDYQGNKVGELELPDGTPPEVVAEKLSIYSRPPSAPELAPVSARQIRLALVHRGLALEAVDEAIDALSEPDRSLAQIEWQFAAYFERSNPMVEAIGGALGWTGAQIDELWMGAAAL